MFECCQCIGIDLGIGVFGWMANKLQQSLKMHAVEVILSSYKLVPECQPHPEDQMRTCVIGFTSERSILDKCGSKF